MTPLNRITDRFKLWNSASSELFRTISSLAYPQYCPECGTVTDTGGGWICERCWQCLSPAVTGLWAQHPRLKTRVFAAFQYSNIARMLIHQMKFYGRRDIAVRLGKLTAERLLMGGLEWPVQAVAPVPLHPVRIRERGYDQNLILAKNLALFTGLPLRVDLIKRVRHTSPQSRLSDKERLVNLRQAFKPRAEIHETIPTSVLIVDDVIHTGATVAGCVEALKNIGVFDTYVAVACG